MGCTHYRRTGKDEHSPTNTAPHQLSFWYILGELPVSCKFFLEHSGRNFNSCKSFLPNQFLIPAEPPTCSQGKFHPTQCCQIHTADHSSSPKKPKPNKKSVYCPLHNKNPGTKKSHLQRTCFLRREKE